MSPVKRIPVKLGDASYDIVVGGALKDFPAVFKGFAKPGTRVGVISDAAVVSSYGRVVAQGLSQAGYDVHATTVASGEHSKTLRQAERLYRFCARAKLERQSWLVAVGGGVVGDLTGFVAATYLRGIPLIQIPTTLLAQVDSAIGGKTGVDVPEGKNLVGAFYQPRLVWSDPATLHTLPIQHWRNGMAEIIKYACIQDAALFGTLEKNMESLLSKKPSALLNSILTRCAAIKARVVERDPQETKGLRAILNFGHSVGHAIEAATGYARYLHGEAVAIGMFIAAFVSQQQGLMEPVDRIRLGTLLTRAGLPIRTRSTLPRARILEYLARDKKVKDGKVQFVLLKKLGQAVPGCEVAPDVLDVCLAAGGIE